MSRDFNDIYQKIEKSHKDLYKQEQATSQDVYSLKKDQDKLIKDIGEIKKEVKDIAFKVDLVLEILNSFTIMLAEAEEEDGVQDDYDTDETWVPDPEEDWQDDN